MAKLCAVVLVAVLAAAAGCDSSPLSTGAGGAHGLAGAGGASISGAGGAGGAHGTCGDGHLDSPEECDDGNLFNGDGCSAYCRVEWAIPPGCANGGSCLVPACGDGVVTGTEACDDSNATAGDGCAADCKTIEAFFTCPVPGRACVATCAPSSQVPACAPGTCGDGVLSGGEQCDCGSDVSHLPAGCTSVNTAAAYGGCTTSCTFGAYCGDGHMDAAGGELCDLGAANGVGYIAHPADPTNPGCSRTCQPSHFCGDGHVDATVGEQCDFGQLNGQPSVDVGGGKKCTVCNAACQLLIDC